MLKAEVSGSSERDHFGVGSGEGLICLYSVAGPRTLVLPSIFWEVLDSGPGENVPGT